MLSEKAWSAVSNPHHPKGVFSGLGVRDLSA